MYRISYYVPEDHLEVTKSALFEAGAGRIGLYEHCCWQTLGVGQFRPLSGSQPAIGELGELTTLPEYKVELVCEEGCLTAAIQALIAAHPYEEPAYEVYRVTP